MNFDDIFINGLPNVREILNDFPNMPLDDRLYSLYELFSSRAEGLQENSEEVYREFQRAMLEMQFDYQGKILLLKSLYYSRDYFRNHTEEIYSLSEDTFSQSLECLLDENVNKEIRNEYLNFILFFLSDAEVPENKMEDFKQLFERFFENVRRNQGVFYQTNNTNDREYFLSSSRTLLRSFAEVEQNMRRIFNENELAEIQQSENFIRSKNTIREITDLLERIEIQQRNGRNDEIFEEIRMPEAPDGIRMLEPLIDEEFDMDHREYFIQNATFYKKNMPLTSFINNYLLVLKDDEITELVLPLANRIDELYNSLKEDKDNQQLKNEFEKEKENFLNVLKESKSISLFECLKKIDWEYNNISLIDEMETKIGFQKIDLMRAIGEDIIELQDKKESLKFVKDIYKCQEKISAMQELLERGKSVVFNKVIESVYENLKDHDEQRLLSLDFTSIENEAEKQNSVNKAVDYFVKIEEDCNDLADFLYALNDYEESYVNLLGEVKSVPLFEALNIETGTNFGTKLNDKVKERINTKNIGPQVQKLVEKRRRENEEEAKILNPEN